MDDIIAELQWRGLVADCTGLDALRKRLAEKPITLYCGFDPTSDSLHVGNLIPLLVLRRFQLMGNKPIALAGGATGLVGDPGGKTSERPLLSRDDLNRNLEGIKPQLRQLLDFDAKTNPARLVDNADWTAPMSCLDFLREVGKHITVNYMMAKEWVKTRMENAATGLSYTEFSYMLIQANDFYHLNKEYNCELQVAGTDQWGNITAGTELCRKKAAKTVYGLVSPLLTNADGAKFGKSVDGAVWLDPKKTRVEDFYQFWVQTDDRDVIQRLKYFTFLTRDEIADLENKLKTKPEERAAQKALADAMTKLVHGDESVQEVKPTEGENIFTIKAKRLKQLTLPALEKVLHGIPEQNHKLVSARGNALPFIDFLVHFQLASSKSDARRTIEAGGITINKVVEKNPSRNIGREDLLCEKFLVVGKGKKNYISIAF
jgi:tyrosyl-tRNA synthetase